MSAKNIMNIDEDGIDDDEMIINIDEDGIDDDQMIINIDDDEIDKSLILLLDDDNLEKIFGKEIKWLSISCKKFLF